jgi:uncharacterized protein (TIGR00255 family)
MTGFVLNEERGEGWALSVGVKGYNSRYLELSVSLPPVYQTCEAELRALVAEKCRRGKVELSIRLTMDETPVSFRLNHRALRSALVIMTQAAAEAEKAIAGSGAVLSLDTKIRLRDLVRMEGVLESKPYALEEAGSVTSADLAGCSAATLRRTVASALNGFCEERRREGETTEKNILAQLVRFEDALAIICSLSPQIERSIKDTIRSRFKELLGDRADCIDENRILAETAVLLNRYTIEEELSRLAAHIKAFYSEVQNNEAPGKKLEFLCQELGREVNTVGSKTPLIEVSRAVVTMKDTLENIREQLRNVE